MNSEDARLFVADKLGLPAECMPSPNEATEGGGFYWRMPATAVSSAPVYAAGVNDSQTSWFGDLTAVGKLAKMAGCPTPKEVETKLRKELAFVADRVCVGTRHCAILHSERKALALDADRKCEQIVVDFGAFLTGRKERLVASACDDASPMVVAIQEFWAARNAANKGDNDAHL